MSRMLSIQIPAPVQPYIPPPPAPMPSWLNVPAPERYEFRVKEITNAGQIVRVQLEYRVLYLDQQGGITEYGTWTTVPRIQEDINAQQPIGVTFP